MPDALVESLLGIADVHVRPPGSTNFHHLSDFRQILLAALGHQVGGRCHASGLAVGVGALFHQSIDAVGFGVQRIEAQLVGDVQAEEQKTGETDAQPGQVEAGVECIAAEVAECGLDKILQHGGVFMSVDGKWWTADGASQS